MKLSEKYRPQARVEQGRLFEEFVFPQFESVVEKYNKLTGKKIEFYGFGGNYEGFDAVFVDSETRRSVGIELKNLRDHYQVQPCWVERHVIGKQYRHPHNVDFIHVLTAGGNYSPEAKEMFRTNQRVIARQMPGMTITSNDQVNEKSLRSRVRSDCWEILEKVFGKVVYSLDNHCTILFDRLIDSIHTIFFSSPPTLYTVNHDPPLAKHNFPQKVYPALIDTINAFQNSNQESGIDIGYTRLPPKFYIKSARRNLGAANKLTGVQNK